jgi:mercuric ion transport protein
MKKIKSVPKPVEQARRRRGSYALMLLALLTCPCHVPILALALTGTAAGALLAEHFEAALGLFSFLFLLSLTAAIRLLRSTRDIQ